MVGAEERDASVGPGEPLKVADQLADPGGVNVVDARQVDHNPAHGLGEHRLELLRKELGRLPELDRALDLDDCNPAILRPAHLHVWLSHLRRQGPETVTSAVAANPPPRWPRQRYRRSPPKVPTSSTSTSRRSPGSRDWYKATLSRTTRSNVPWADSVTA